ncbi:MAG: CHASE3 domain-containing protein [Bacteroidetes bacterium]|nr:CHASE3 domain-containing protein [Fibrella sp.]
MDLITRLLPNRTNRRIVFGFVAALLLIAAGFAMSFYNYSQYSKANRQVERTSRTINTLDVILSLMKDAETGVRGYVISGDELFLEPNTTARLQLPGRIRELRALVADNASQRQQTDTLVGFIDAKLSIGDRQIQIRRANQVFEQGYLLVGKIRMDRVREQVARMIASERRLMQARNSGVNDSFRNTLLVTLALSVLTFVTLIVSYNLLETELNRRQRNEDQLRAYEEELRDRIRQLEASNEELERFAFVASHDLQEPLRKIQSFGSLITQRCEAVLDAEALLFLRKMMQSAGRMSDLIKDLLHFSRLSADKDEFKPVRVADIIQRVLDDRELVIKALGAVVEVGRMPVVQAIPSQIAHLFTNLISNALKFVRSGVTPVIRIQAEAIDGDQLAELTPGQKYYRFTITDNGIGFDEKYADHIFKVFQRLHGKSTYEGTGIGLAICKKVVMYHKGYITAQSRPGEGSSFVVLLPEKQTDDFDDQSVSDKAHSHTPGRRR